MSIHSISTANTLNGITIDSAFNTNKKIAAKFIAPDARVLIVDDIDTNLKIAAGLLRPYKMQVELCDSGREAIEALKLKSYDLIFMDHMMPEMDGIEATAAIRDLEKEQSIKSKKQIPIIALTANAVPGIREMFLEKGFNDFLSKPIDISRLEEILDHWIPQEKKKKTGNMDDADHTSLLQPATSGTEPLIIPGVDVEFGIKMTGGTAEFYIQTLAIFLKDTEERLPIVQTAPSADDLPLFVINIHAIKSAAASIGAAKVSTTAKELEAAGNAKDLALINKLLPDFIESITILIKDIKSSLKSYAEKE